MNIHPVETMAIIFIAMLIGIGVAKMFDKSDFFEEFMTKKYRKKYFLRKFHKELLSEKKDVSSVINMCFYDIRNRYDFRKLIIDEKKELIVKRKDFMEGIKYALSLCYVGVLSKKRESEVVERIFALISMPEDAKEKLSPFWYEEDEIIIGDYMLLEAYQSVAGVSLKIKNLKTGEIELCKMYYGNIYNAIGQIMKADEKTVLFSFVYDDYVVSAENLKKEKQNFGH